MVVLCADEEMAAVSLHPSCRTDFLREIVHDFTLFALHSSNPYVQRCKYVNHDKVKVVKVGGGRGFPDYLTSMQHKLYDLDYPGPFTIGVSWQQANNEDDIGFD